MSKLEWAARAVFRSADGRTAAFFWLFLALLGGSAQTIHAADPGWWQTQGAVTAGVTQAPNAVVNQGQLKAFVVAAVHEMDTDLAGSGGAGDALNNLVTAWQEDYATNAYATNLNNPTYPYKPTDFDAVTVGQLKYTASLVYNRLRDAGYTSLYPSWIAVNASTDSSLAVLGQLKAIFNFDPGIPPAGSGRPMVLDDTVSGQVGQAFSYQIVATNSPTNYAAPGLPPGLALNASTGLISGTPLLDGTAVVPLTAYNNAGKGSATLNLTISPTAPVITSTGTATGTVNKHFSYRIVANNVPTSYAATGLPAGLSVDTGTGVINGVPTQPFSSSVNLSAINAAGTGTMTLTLSITPGVPIIGGSLNASGVVGSAFTYQIVASNQPTSYTASNLPAGWSFNSTTGVISGTPTGHGVFNVVLSATNPAGTATANLTLTIASVTPVVTSASNASGQMSVAFSYQIAASNSPISFGASGLPAGLNVNVSTGLISGTPAQSGNFSVELGATNDGGTGAAILSLTISPMVPVITSAGNAGGQLGAPFLYEIRASQSPTRYSTSGLPPGLSINAITGAISGTPTQAGTFAVSLGATNGTGTGTASLSLTITTTAPVITSALSASVQVNTLFSYQITATNSAASFGASGLPAGLSVNTATGAVAGTPTQTGNFSVTIAATNAGDTASATLDLIVTAGQPGGSGSDPGLVAPSSLCCLGQAAGAVQLTWQDNSNDEDSFKIQRESVGGNWRDIGSVAANGTLFVDPSPATVPAFYRVVAANASGQSAGDPVLYSPGATVTITSPVSGQQTTAHGSFTLTAVALNDNVSISKVIFFEGVNQIGEADATPFTTTWSDVPGGSHTITAVATDTAGTQSTSDPVTVQATAFPFITAGGDQSFAMAADGTLWAWGNNGDGQLGTGSIDNSYNIPYELSGTTGTRVVAAGAYHTLVVNADGSVSAFGNNEYDQLGLGTGTESDHPAPTLVSGLSNVSALAAGDQSSVALTTDGKVWTWGNGQASPVQVAGLSNVTAIAAGSSHFLALAADQTVWAWGSNSAGQLGTGDTDDAPAPVQITGLSGIRAIAAGTWHSVALGADGSVYTWGDNQYGELGQGNFDPSYLPMQVSNLSAIAAVATHGTHTLVLTTGGVVWAFGNNDSGQIGDSSFQNRNAPVKVAGNLPTILQIAAGAKHSLALTKDGSILEWGANDYGQLGGGVDSPQLTDEANLVSSLNGTSSSSATGSGQGKPNPGGGGIGPQLDPDHDYLKVPSEPAMLVAQPYYMPPYPVVSSSQEVDSTAYLTWTLGGKETPQSIIVQRRESVGNWTNVGSADSTATKYKDPGLYALTAYRYRLLITYTDGRVLYSNVVPYNVPLFTDILTKYSSPTSYTAKSAWSFPEFYNGKTYPAIPHYYLQGSLDYSQYGGESAYKYLSSPAQHLRYESYIDYDTLNGQVLYYFYCTDQERRPGTTTDKPDTRTKVFDLSASGVAYHFEAQYQSKDQYNRWNGYDYDPQFGSYIYSGIYNYSDDVYSIQIQASLDSTATWQGTLTDSEGAHPWSSGLFNGNPPNFLTYLDQFHLDYEEGDVTSPTSVGDTEEYGAMTLSNEYSTGSFITQSSNDMPDYPIDFRDFPLGTDTYEFNCGVTDKAKGYYQLAYRNLLASKDQLYISKILYKFKTNPLKSGSVSINEIFVPDQDPTVPSVPPVPEIIRTINLTGEASDNDTEYELDPYHKPDDDPLSDTSQNGSYYLVPGFNIVAYGSIPDQGNSYDWETASDDTTTTTAYELDAQQQAQGSAILTPASSGNLRSELTGSFEVPYVQALCSDPASLSYTLGWTNPDDVNIFLGKKAITNNTQLSEKDLTEANYGRVFKVEAKASAHEGEVISITIAESLSGKKIGQSMINYTVHLDRPVRDYSIPFDEASGARYRKLALNGRPLSDEKPQQTAESDQEKEQTYIDALTLGFHHSTTDIYVPVASSDLVLSARRDTISEVWNMRNGLRPHERFDRPFGAGWTSNLVPSVEKFTKDSITYCYVTDQNGSVHRYIAPLGGDGQYVPLPSDQRENGDYLTTFNGGVFTDQFGTQIIFDASNTSPVITRQVAGDRTAASDNETHQYYRTLSITDRMGNSLVYKYPGVAVTLIPSEITLVNATGNQPKIYTDETLYIRQDTAGHITDTWDPNGDHFQYAYQQTASYTADGQSSQETTLYSVTAPDGGITYYTYDLEIEQDLTPASINLGHPTDQIHLDINSITDPLAKTTELTYQFDQSKFSYDPAANKYFPETGAPRNVVQVQLPGVSGTPYFENESAVKLTYDQNGLPTIGTSPRKNQVTDAVGNTFSYTFSDAQVFNVAGFYVSTPAWAIPKVVFYTTMTMDYPGIGQEVFKFNSTAGLSLASAQNLSGNTTYYYYEDASAYNVLNVNGFASSESYLLSPFGNLYGNCNQPTSQINAESWTKTFSYTPQASWHLLSDTVDEEGRKTHYGFDDLGRRTEADVYDVSGTMVQQTTFEYDPTFPSFVDKTTLQQLSVGTQPSWAGSIVTQFVPDQDGRVARRILDPSGLNLTTSYTYDNNGNKLTETDPRQHTTLFTYDTRNRLTNVSYPDGSQKRYVYDLNGNKLQEWDENNHATLFDYDDQNRLKDQARDMNGDLTIERGTDLVTSYTYNDVNSPLTVTDPNGNVTTTTYDELQRVWTVQRPMLSQTTRYEYAIDQNCGGSVFDSSSFKPTKITDPAGYETDNTYDPLGRPMTSVRHYQASPLGSLIALTTTTFDNVANLKTVTDPLGHTTTTTYDALNRPTQVAYADGTSTQASYTSTGLKWQTVDEAQHITDIQHDGAGRPTDVFNQAVTNAVTGETLIPHTHTIYDANGNITGVVDPRLNEADYTFDARNRRTDEYEPAVPDADSGNSPSPHVHTEYDHVGNRTAVTDARGNLTRYSPDAANRITHVQAPAVPLNGDGTSGVNPTTDTVYDLNGNVRSVTDANSHTTTNLYDGLNRLTATIDPENDAVEYGYDNLSNRTDVSAGLRWDGSSFSAGSNPQQTHLDFDGLSRNTQITYPGGNVTQFTYDAVNKVSRQDGNGQTTTYDLYDGRNRLRHITYPAGSNGKANADNRAYTYDPVGRLLTSTEGQGGATDAAYTYDALGRVQTDTSRGVTHAYGYDAVGNRTSTQYGALNGPGRLLTSTYDALNRLSTLTEGGRPATTYQYDLSGNVRVKTLPNGESEVTHYDALDRQTDSSDGTLYMYGYGHDAMGNLTTMSEYKAGLPSRYVTMSYYPSDRLQTETVYAGTQAHGPPTSSTTYAYDEMGNRTSRQVAGGQTTTYTYNGAGQLQGYSDHSGTSVSYGYDGNGNRLSRTQGNTGSTYGYDAENRLVSVVQGGTSYAYLYDYRTRRVGRQEGNTLAQVIFSGGTSVEEYTTHVGDPPPANNAPPAPDVEFVRGSDWGGGVGGILYSLHNTTTTNSSTGQTQTTSVPSFDHYDARGDVATQTNNAGTVTYQGEYEAWGTRTAEYGSDADRQRANTKEEDPTGLLDEGMRYRDLETGVFLTRDPLGMVDGPNEYAYVRQNPWSKFDPEGLFTADDVIRWTGAGPVLDGVNNTFYGTLWTASRAADYGQHFLLGGSWDQEAQKSEVTTNLESKMDSFAKSGVYDPRSFVPSMTKTLTEVGTSLVLAKVGLSKEEPNSSVEGVTAKQQAEANQQTASNQTGDPGAYVKSNSPAVQRTLPKDKNGILQPDTDVPHSQLGRSTRSHGAEPQAREWMYDESGRLVPKRDIDFTDHGMPSIHPDPHQHTLTPQNPEQPVRGGLHRSDPEPLQQ